MYWNIFIFACLLHLASSLKLELFLNSSGQNDYDFACCFDRFVQILAERNNQQKSVIVFLPQSVSDSAEVKGLPLPKSREPYPWSVEIWRPEKCLKNNECRRSIAVGNNFIFVQFKDYRSLLSEGKIKFTNSSNICIAQIIQKKFRKNLIKAKDLSGVRCSILKTTPKKVNTMRSADESPITETSFLHVAGIASSPFVYYGDGNNLKGFDVSLITAVAKKLKMPLSINVIGARESEELNKSLTTGSFANR